MKGVAAVFTIKSKINPNSCFVISEVFHNTSENEVNCYLNKEETFGVLCTNNDLFYQTEDKNITLSCAGKIYNILGLKQLLIHEGVMLDSNQETEILLKAYLHFGKDLIHHINGSYALIIWNAEKEEGLVFRDRLGKTPLFIYKSETALYVSTELRSLSALLPNLNWDSEAIQYYFRLGYIPAPFTVYKDIRKLEQGSFIEFSNSEVKIQKFWKIEDKVSPETITSEVAAKTRYHELLVSSVKNQLSFKKTGIFLSGGIDSSLVAAVAQSVSKSKLNTFSVSFPESPNDESAYARKVAKKLGTIHHEVSFTHQSVLDLLDEFSSWYEEPYADASGFPTFFLSRVAKEHVDEILTGDGGDEQFLGYGMHVWAERLHKASGFKPFAKTLLALSPKENHNRASNYFDYDDVEDINNHIFSVDQGMFSQHQIRKYFNFQVQYHPLTIDEVGRGLHPSERQALYEMKYYLPGDLLRKVERAAHQNKLMVHTPLLDYRLVEESINYNRDLKMSRDADKYLLRQILYDYLPKEIFERPKWGFGLPLKTWLSKELLEVLDKYVNPTVLKEYEFYNVKEIMKLKHDFLGGKSYLFNQLWLIIVFNLWAEKHSK